MRSAPRWVVGLLLTASAAAKAIDLEGAVLAVEQVVGARPVSDLAVSVPTLLEPAVGGWLILHPDAR